MSVLTLLSIAAIAAVVVVAGPTHKPAAHGSHTAALTLHAPVARIFAYFGPVREAEWAAGWTPEMLYSPLPEGGEGAVFRTAAQGKEMLWQLARWDERGRHVTYITVIAGERMGRIDIQCEDLAGGKSRCAVTYSYTALGPEGETFIAAFTAEQHRERVAHWEQAINHLLATGKRLEHA